MRIGLDLDNTIIDYDAAFAAAAEEAGLVEPGQASTKRAIRDHLWSCPDGDLGWQRLQARVYGPGIGAARPATGFRAFLGRALDSGAEVFIISHKTRAAAADPDGADLREAALGWLSDQGFIGHGALARSQVLFSDTRAAKVAMIAEKGCTLFVDDLTEVLFHPDFPAYVRRLHYAPDGETARAGAEACRSWAEAQALIFGSGGKSDADH